jgi:transcriptional regulator with XRE-family HTH domain
MTPETAAPQEESTPDLTALYDRGLTYQQIAEALGCSKQHVTNLLNKAGLPTRSAAESARIRDARTLADHGDTIRDRFLATRNVKAVAAEHDVTVAAARRFLTELVPDMDVLTAARRTGTNRYSREELLDSLRAAASAAGGGILTAAKYRDYIVGNPRLPDGRPRPGGQAMGLRFGSWGDALRAAGLEANPHAGPAKQFDDPAVALDAVVACWQDLGSPPTVGDYDTWQRGKAGRPGSSVARRLLGPWNTALVRAWQVVHGITLDQDDPDTTVPETTGDDVGAPYRPADETTTVQQVAMSLDGYLAQERAVRAHARLQNAVAAGIQAAGHTPRSPRPDEPQYDVAYLAADGTFTVVEVKSCTPDNVELQLRLGLGQVLRYAHQLRARHQHVRAVLATELAPPAEWPALLDSLNVAVLREPDLQHDLDQLLAPTAAPGPTRP